MQEHKRWLKIVEDDLKSAKLLLKNEVFSTSTYHCQQAAKKALKAYLVFRKHEIVKIHDLMKLIVMCCKFDTSFEQLYKDAGSLNPLATKFRYPTEFDIPDLADTKCAIKQAQKIIDFVLSKISESETNQQGLFLKN